MKQVGWKAGSASTALALRRASQSAMHSVVSRLVMMNATGMPRRYSSNTITVYMGYCMHSIVEVGCSM